MIKFTNFLWMLFFIGLFVFGVEFYFSTPVVYWSTSSNECVKVIHDGIELDCSDMPEEYERVWVE